MNRLAKYLFLVLGSLYIYSCFDDNKNSENGNSEEDKQYNTEIIVDLSDEELLDLAQESTFNYFWNYAEENSGAARERYVVDSPDTDKSTVTTGGTGFGLMAIIVAIERGFISAEDGVNRIEKILDFFENADRFHGVWPHWLDGSTGKVIPFSNTDNGGDLVETSFFAQALIVIYEY